MDIEKCQQIETFQDALNAADLSPEQYKSAKKYIEGAGYDLSDNCITDPIHRYNAYASHYKVMLAIESKMGCTYHP